MLGNGNGTFHVPVSFAVRNLPGSLAIGDFNGDGKKDLIVANSSPNVTSTLIGTVSVLMGNGNGTFRTAVNYIVGRVPTSVVIGDFNGDSKPDFAVRLLATCPSSQTPPPSPD